MDKAFKTAFTLIELLVVIAIIGILSGLIVVTLSGVTQKANIAKSQVFSNSLRNALMINLVAEYKLDGNANDSWSGRNGTLHGTTAVTSGCPQGTCFSFNGSSDYVNIADDDVFNFGSKMTAMVWAKGVAQAGKVIFGQWNQAAGLRAWMIRVYGNAPGSALEVYLSDDGTVNTNHFFDYTTNSAVFDNNWHLVGFTWNSGILKLYVDGVNMAVSGTTGPFISLNPNSDSDLTIGCGLASGSPASFFTGQIDEARLYNVSIPTSKIKEQYYAGLNNLLYSKKISASEYQERLNTVAER